MKKLVTLVFLAACAAIFSSCGKDVTPPTPAHVDGNWAIVMRSDLPSFPNGGAAFDVVYTAGSDGGTVQANISYTSVSPDGTQVVPDQPGQAGPEYVAAGKIRAWTFHGYNIKWVSSTPVKK